jgi:hypothetical protein
MYLRTFNETRCDAVRQARCDWLRKDDTMTDDTMTNSAMTSTAARLRLSSMPIEYVLRPRLTAAAKAGLPSKPASAALKRVRENLFRPSGTRSESPLYPGLTSWANIFRPSGAGNRADSLARLTHRLVLTHTLKRCATQTLALVFITATSLCLLCVCAPAQTHNQTQAQTRQQLLQE